MDIEEIKTLTDLMVDNDLSEIMIRDGDKRIVIRRKGAGADQPVVIAQPQPVVTPLPPAPAALPTDPTAGSPAAPAAARADADAGLEMLKSPMVGTYYVASDPESPPFVRIGDRVTPDSVVCIIEAMKVYNEIKAETSGIIEAIEVENAAAVEYDQVLMKIRPG